MPFTGNITELEAAISKFSLGGTTALYDGIALAETLFARAGHARKVLLVITDGGDNSSHTTLNEIKSSTAELGVVIYPIGIFDETNSDRNPAILKALADATGGTAHFPTAVNDITKICVEIATDIRQQYTLGFPGAEDGEFHAIKVRAKSPSGTELTVHTQPGYFATKPPAGKGSASRIRK
jgi:VWFA-related protein